MFIALCFHENNWTKGPNILDTCLKTDNSVVNLANRGEHLSMYCGGESYIFLTILKSSLLANIIHSCSTENTFVLIPFSCMQIFPQITFGHSSLLFISFISKKIFDLIVNFIKQ